MKRKWKKKILKAVGISLCMAMLGCGLAACGNNKSGAGGGEAEGGGQEASPEEEATITFYWGSIEDDMKQVWYDGFFDPFVEEHPNVKIDFQCLPDVQETLRVQLAAGSGPDLFMVRIM